MSTARTMSAPSSRATSVGIGSTTPPSTRDAPSIVTDWITPGMALEARTARPSGPRSRTTRRPVESSVATARKGIFVSSMFWTFALRFTNCSIRSPDTGPFQRPNREKSKMSSFSIVKAVHSRSRGSAPAA